MFCWKKNCERQSLLQFSFSTWSERSGDRTPPKERSGAKRSKATQPKAEAEGRLIAPQPTPPQVERPKGRSGGGGKAENERLQRRSGGALERRSHACKGGRSERPSGEQANACKGGRLVGASKQANTSRSECGGFIHNVDYITRVKPALHLEYN